MYLGAYDHQTFLSRGPYCGNTTLFMCGNCKKLACWDGENSHVICPHCGFEGDLDSCITEIHGDGNY